MSVKIAACNVGRGLSDEARQQSIADTLRAVDADIVVLSEAFDQSDRAYDPDFAAKLGYTSMITTEYEDRMPHTSGKQYLTVLGKSALQTDVVRIGNRNGLVVDAVDPDSQKPFRLFTAHWEDRSPVKRRIMSRSLTYKLEPSQPVVVAADFNELHSRTMRAFLLRSWPAKLVARLVPNQKWRSLATRLTSMATGEGLSLLKKAGLVDADPKHRPTKKFGPLRAVQLDRFMYTPGLMALCDFQIHPTPGSDHDTISSVVHVF